MKQHLNIKLWTERKALSRGRWGGNDWEKRYCMSWGNKNSWRDEKKKLSAAQKRVILQYQLDR